MVRQGRADLSRSGTCKRRSNRASEVCAASVRPGARRTGRGSGQAEVANGGTSSLFAAARHRHRCLAKARQNIVGRISGRTHGENGCRNLRTHSGSGISKCETGKQRPGAKTAPVKRRDAYRSGRVRSGWRNENARCKVLCPRCGRHPVLRDPPCVSRRRSGQQVRAGGPQSHESQHECAHRF